MEIKQAEIKTNVIPFYKLNEIFFFCDYPKINKPNIRRNRLHKTNFWSLYYVTENIWTLIQQEYVENYNEKKHLNETYTYIVFSWVYGIWV